MKKKDYCSAYSPMDGFVYILHNESPYLRDRLGLLKIGKTGQTLGIRSRQVSKQTGCFGNFVPIFAVYLKEYEKVELVLKRSLRSQGHLTQDNKEFTLLDVESVKSHIISIIETMKLSDPGLKVEYLDFSKMPEEQAKDIIENLSGCKTYDKPTIPTKAVLSDLDHRKFHLVDRHSSGIAKDFNFKAIGISQGEILVFKYNNLEVEVCSDVNMIKYQGEEYTLTGFTTKFIPDEHRTFSNKYQGPKYFTRKNDGKSLLEIRSEALKITLEEIEVLNSTIASQYATSFVIPKNLTDTLSIN